MYLNVCTGVKVYASVWVGGAKEGGRLRIRLFVNPCVDVFVRVCVLCLGGCARVQGFTGMFVWMWIYVCV